jgi:deoxyribose-phosphate aldolase
MAKDIIICLYILGADFIKTSTGKEGVNAILMVALVMVRAIREYFERTGHKVSIN